MNIFTDAIAFNMSAIKTAIFAIQFLVALSIVAYGLLYVFYAPHVSSRHVGMKHPKYIIGTIKTGMVIALFTGGVMMFAFMTGSF